MARADAGLTISELAERAGVSRDTISNAERGRHGLQATTLHKVARALGRTPSELLAEEERLAPKVESSSLEPSFYDVLEDERLERWRAAVEEARQLRATGPLRMQKALSAWRARKERGEPYATRRRFLDEMGDLLQQAYAAVTALAEALAEQGFSMDRWHQLQEADRFYFELCGLVEDVGLSIQARTAEDAQPETRTHRVDDPAA